MKITFYSTIASVLFLSLLAIVLNAPKEVAGSAFTGQSAYLQTATTTTLNTATKGTIAASNDYCKSRVITTNGIGVYLSFGDTTGFGSTTLANAVGHWQPASTTVAYDGGLYGCGLLTGYANATTTLTVSQF